MAQKDCWSHQERSIVSLFEVGFITGSGTITEGDMLEFSAQGTGAWLLHGQNPDGVIYMEGSTGRAGASGIALKSASSGDTLPVMFHGIHKLTIAGGASETTYKISAGSFVCNSASKTTITDIWSACGGVSLNAAFNFIKGLSHILGMAMQIGSNADEILVLVGRSL